MKGYHFVLAVVFIALASSSFRYLAAWEGSADKKAKDDETSVWMKRKLLNTQQILAGLTKGDFDMIRKHAEEMVVIGYLEKADRADIPEYKRQMRYFEEANKEVIRQAKNKNLNGATLAYTQVTLSCVHCHNVVRDRKKK